MSDGSNQSREQAESRFQKAQKKQNALEAGAKAKAEHDAAGRATREKTSRLRSLRLEKEAADKEAAAQEKLATPRKKAKSSAPSKKAK